MSDVRKGLKKFANSPTVERWERGEKSEGVRDALRAGAGNVKAGAKKLRMQKSGLPAELRRAKTCPCPGKKGS